MCVHFSLTSNFCEEAVRYLRGKMANTAEIRNVGCSVQRDTIVHLCIVVLTNPEILKVERAYYSTSQLPWVYTPANRF